MDDVELRALVAPVLSVLVRRGADFATAEDAVQEALIRAHRTWPDEPPVDAKAWLITVAWRVFLDLTRSEAARRDREVRVDTEPPTGEVPSSDDTLRLYFLCASPELTPSSAVALTLRAVGGLTTRQIAQAYLVPEATMAQRISRAKRTVGRTGLDRPGDVGTVMRVLYLVFNEGYSGDVDLAAEAIRLTRQLAALVEDPEVDGLLALMLLHHARRAGRTGPDGRLVPLAEQDRSRWDTELITEGVAVLQPALARDQLGEFQVQAAIAALHADAQRVEETDWVQIVEWYDELLAFADTPIVRLNRAVAVGEADGAPAGLAALAEVADDVPRRDAVAAHLHERNGDLDLAARLYAAAARNAPSVQEREHQTRQAARLNQTLRQSWPGESKWRLDQLPRRRNRPPEPDHRRRSQWGPTVEAMDFEPGRFPFGRPNTQRPMRRATGAAKALVVGVYPSAFHVRWTSPGGGAGIASLAVDVEPVVFWDGVEPNPADLLKTWVSEVGFVAGEHGEVTVGHNGPSGDGLTRDTLSPLGLKVDDVAFTDAVPWFFIKFGKGSQGAAIANRFADGAAAMGVHAGSLPPRPSTKALVAIAASDHRREELRSEIVDAGASEVITLGQEALDAVVAVADRPPEGVQEKLRPDGYGAVGTLTVHGIEFTFRPLVHPGFRRQTSEAAWRGAFTRWREDVGS